MPHQPKLTFATMTIPAKVLATCIIFTLAFGMIGALGQIIVHDIIPTFITKIEPMSVNMSTKSQVSGMSSHKTSTQAPSRGDLFDDLKTNVSEPEDTPFYKDEQFVWTLKWTHIHLFGINMIFIFLGGLTIFLDMSSRVKTWLIVLPFMGVLVDILAMWLKGFVSSVFFWLHIPGGGVFAIIFGYVSIRALWEMWIKPI